MATTPDPDIQQQSQLIPPQEQQGQEHTTSAPMQGKGDDPQNSGNISKDDQQRLIALVRRYKEQWSQNRLFLRQRCIRNLEFFKGNQYISFSPGSTQFSGAGGDWFGAGISNGTHEQNADDTDLYQMCNNFYQMLCVGFIAALCPQVPKSKWMPEDADELTDVATAKAAQTLIDVIERKNKEASLLKLQLMYLFTCGTVYRHTRYIVSADRVGTKKQPIFNVTDTEILPDRMHCYNCGADNPAQTQQCANCAKPMMDDNFYPAVTGPVTQKVGTENVPQGAVIQDLYSPLDVDMDPSAETIMDTPIINLDMEVHLSALRGAYPDMYADITASATSTLSPSGSQDRIFRQQVYSQTYGTDTLADQKPTLSRSWIASWAFDLEDDKEFGKRMRIAFPSGCLLINTGETFLNAKQADPNKEWTRAKTHEGYGMNPPAPGDIVVPFQEVYNDLASIMREGIDRGFNGLIFGNDDLIGGKAMNGKPPLPGIINPIKLKRTGAPGSFKLQDSMWQFEIELKIREGMEYCKEQMMNAQMFAMVPPQVYGGKGDPNVETFGGQQLQTDKAMGVLNIYWENLKDEHAEADALAVMCAKDNLTEDVRKVVEEKGGYQNEYIRLDDLQGSVHSYSDTDQGLPVTAAELRQRWMDLLNAAEKNPVVQAIFDDPANQDQAASSIGVPGMVVPGSAMRSKTLMILDKLIKAQAIPQVDPQTGQPTGQMQPSIMPDAQIDDFDVAKKTVRQYCQSKPQIANDFPQGFQNILAYLTALTAAETAFNTQQASDAEVVKGKAALAGTMASTPPPPPPPKLTPEEQSLISGVRQAGAEAEQDLLKIAGTPALGQGESLQAQVAAGNALLQLAAKVEQIAADKTSIQ